MVIISAIAAWMIIGYTQKIILSKGEHKMSNETVSISVERYNELIRKETIYDIQRMLILKDKYRSDTESIMYGVPTREEAAANDL